ncbi:hypothetical protein NIES4071_13290 [Calothrix sp. NIES-4071]|nr:hypothetical protein NIES4071_13290 [Calothrix sp. NIES-4071]BAZ55669.1 hypothetical protein NIES4105_13250 [Calothrix sp. NIES-4105]
MGDALIALNSSVNLLLEHTNNSFDYLCPPIKHKQPHQKHPSENEILMKMSVYLE